jgi:hypothetical protein
VYLTRVLNVICDRFTHTHTHTRTHTHTHTTSFTGGDRGGERGSGSGLERGGGGDLSHADEPEVHSYVRYVNAGDMTAQGLQGMQAFTGDGFGVVEEECEGSGKADSGPREKKLFKNFFGLERRRLGGGGGVSHSGGEVGGATIVERRVQNVRFDIRVRCV